MAVTIDATTLATYVNQGEDMDTAEKDRLLALAVAVYESEALHDPDTTPDALSDEFVVRVAGYLSQSRDSLGQLDLARRAHAQDPARASGARALISRFLELTA